MTGEALRVHVAKQGAAAAFDALPHAAPQLDRRVASAPPGELIRAVVEGGYGDYGREVPERATRASTTSSQLAEYARSTPTRAASSAEIALLNEFAAEEAVVAGEPPDESVVLSIVHQAKGLEWSAVVRDLARRGPLPQSTGAARARGRAEEERRLFYVAVTRAKNEVALVYPMLARDRYGVDVILEPSRFLTELPDAVYERWTIEREPTPEDDAASAPEDERVH